MAVNDLHRALAQIDRSPRLTRSRRGNRLVHPGEILHMEFLHPNDLSQNALARALGTSPRRVNEVCLGKRAITPRFAILLGDLFGTGAHFWLYLQADYDIEQCRRPRGAR